MLTKLFARLKRATETTTVITVPERETTRLNRKLNEMRTRPIHASEVSRAAR